MKGVAVVLNVVSFLFTCFVLVTDGAPKDAPYLAFTAMLLLVPVFTVYALVTGMAARRAAAVCNLVVLTAAVWAIVDQYPHPAEPGVIPYAVLILLTPAISALVLFRSGKTDARPELHAKGATP